MEFEIAAEDAKMPKGRASSGNSWRNGCGDEDGEVFARGFAGTRAEAGEVAFDAGFRRASRVGPFRLRQCIAMESKQQLFHELAFYFDIADFFSKLNRGFLWHAGVSLFQASAHGAQRLDNLRFPSSGR